MSEVNKGIQVPGEDDDGTSSNPELLKQKIEDKATKKGWKPLSEFSGDEVDFVDAKEFLAREPLLVEIRELKKHIKTQREKNDVDMKLISTQFTHMSEQSYKRALADLVAQRDYAIENKDAAAIKQLDTEIDTTKEDHRKVVSAVTQGRTASVQPTEEMQTWRAENDWFDNDQELQDEAVAIGVGYLAKNPGKTQVQMLKHVTDRIKKIYPEKFPSLVKRKEENDDDMDETDVRVERSKPSPKLGDKNKGKRLTVADLNDTEKTVMKTLLKRGVLKEVAEKNKRTEQEEFLAQLAEIR